MLMLDCTITGQRAEPRVIFVHQIWRQVSALTQLYFSNQDKYTSTLFSPFQANEGVKQHEECIINWALLVALQSKNLQKEVKIVKCTASLNCAKKNEKNYIYEKKNILSQRTLAPKWEFFLGEKNSAEV